MKSQFVPKNTTSFEAYPVSHQTPERFATLHTLFAQRIEPLYGDQTSALEKIGKSLDRHCELIHHSSQNTDPVGVIVYKTIATEEFASYGLHHPLEIKTLFVNNPEANSGKGIGSELLRRVESYALAHEFTSLVVTVSQDRQDSLAFFQKKGFEVRHSFLGKYQEGKTEFLLAKTFH